MDFVKDLNDEQLYGVTCQDQYIKVIAGAGSGKTRVLTYRIAFLIKERGVRPSQVLGITFTNKAAREIKERVNRLLSLEDNIDLSTIHSCCARFLRRYADAIEYPRNFSILDEDDQLQVMKNIFVNHNLQKNDPHIKECLAWISSKKTEGIQYKDLEGTHYPNDLLNRFLSYFKEYTEILKKTASLDFDDLLLKTIEILENEENGIRRIIQHHYVHILVDEFQDINDVQFYLIKLLMNSETNLYVVGDPDQTIYTWRGANNKIMINLEKQLRYDYKNAVVNTILLQNNYRSSGNILKCANTLIKNNHDRIEKNLVAINSSGEQVSFYNGRTVGEEASYIATIIDDLVRENKAEYNNFAILYRSNYLTRELETQLSLRRIPYRLFGGQKFYQRREIKDILSYLNLLVNPLDDQAFERIINVPKRNIGPTSLQQIKKEADVAGQSLYLYVRENCESINLPQSKRKALNLMIRLLENTKNNIDNSENKDYGDIINKFIDDIDYFNYIKEEENGDERIENVKELVGTIKIFFSSNLSATFEDFVTNAALQASSDEVNDGDYVSLMTVHTAKGLEFDNVFIYGFNEGVFPSSRALEESPKNEEEERRLAYVAITRAKKKLYITCNQDFSFVNSTYLKPSRFVKEAGIVIPKTYDRDEYRKKYINPFLKSSYQNQATKPTNNPAPPINKTNGVDKWNVGDHLKHEQFGIGIVKKVVSDKLIEVEFDDKQYGTKTLLSSHYKINKLYS